MLHELCARARKLIQAGLFRDLSDFLSSGNQFGSNSVFEHEASRYAFEKMLRQKQREK